jgi:acetylornithine deacetylase/succinyl-diaminopimelate desuccinylase-like protein
VGPIGTLVCILGIHTAWAAPETPAEIHENAHDIFKQLIEINTTDSIGSTTVAAQAILQRLLEAGFPAADVNVFGPNERKGDMVARYRGKAGIRKRPILIIAHPDVVGARREDWTTDPFSIRRAGRLLLRLRHPRHEGQRRDRGRWSTRSSRSIRIPGAS